MFVTFVCQEIHSSTSHINDMWMNNKSCFLQKLPNKNIHQLWPNYLPSTMCTLPCLDVKGCPTQGDKYYQLSKVYTKKEMATSVAQSAFNASFTNKLIKSKKNIQVNWSSSTTKNGFATLTFFSNYIKSLLKKKKQA